MSLVLRHRTSPYLFVTRIETSGHPGRRAGPGRVGETVTHDATDRIQSLGRAVQPARPRRVRRPSRAGRPGQRDDLRPLPALAPYGWPRPVLDGLAGRGR